MNSEDVYVDEDARYALHCPLILSKIGAYFAPVEYDRRYLAGNEPDLIKEFIIRLREVRKQYPRDSEDYELITESIFVATKLYEDITNLK